MQKQKKCKGSGKAIGYGCGLESIIFKFGLCRDCFGDWLFHSENGKIYFEKTKIQGNKKIQKYQKKEESQEREEKAQKMVDSMSPDKYRAKYVQPIINEIARLIDNGQPCIASGSMSGKMSGGHFWSVGSNRTTCLNLHNIHIQSFHSNSALGGDNIRYREGIIKTYGIAYMEQIEALKLLKPIKLSKEELIEIKKIASEIRNGLKKYPERTFSPIERIELREQINQRIGIYN